MHGRSGGTGSAVVSAAMDDTLRRRRARSWSENQYGIVDDYDAARPGYPADAIRWLLGAPGLVLELACGTGKLSFDLVAAGNRVVASDPAAPMLKRLRRKLRDRPGDLTLLQATAEQLPVRSSTVDKVIAAQAFHWFDPGPTLAEISRVLRPGGTVGLIWNIRDESVPWVRRLTQLIGSEQLSYDPVEVLEESDLFDAIETKAFRHWQWVDRDSLLQLIRSRSYYITLEPEAQDKLLSDVGALYDEYGRGHDGMLMPYRTECFRARVSSLANFRRDSGGDAFDDGLLIDFT